jgi:hypothetical protein
MMYKPCTSSPRGNLGQGKKKGTSDYYRAILFSLPIKNASSTPEGITIQYSETSTLGPIKLQSSAIWIKGLHRENEGMKELWRPMVYVLAA